MDNFKRLWVSTVVGLLVGLLLTIFTQLNEWVLLAVVIFVAFALFFITGVKKADGSFKQDKFWE